MIIAVPILFALAYLHPYLPGHNVRICAVYQMLHVDCPGCGMTRSLSAFLHGSFLESWTYHPLGIVVALGLVYVWFKAVFNRVAGRHVPLLGEFELALARVFVVALFLTWVTRIIL